MYIFTKIIYTYTCMYIKKSNSDYCQLLERKTIAFDATRWVSGTTNGLEI